MHKRDYEETKSELNALLTKIKQYVEYIRQQDVTKSDILRNF